MKLNADQVAWSQRYQTALRKHLAQGRGANLKPAFELGRKAVLLKLETLDVIRIHEQSLLALVSKLTPTKNKQHIVGQAKFFFMETIVPIEKTHLAALKNDDRVDQLAKVLRRRTIESTTSNRQLQQSIAHRQAAEAALKKSRIHLSKLLQKSRMLQKRLKMKTQAHLAKHEDARKRASRQLQDDIVQALVAIKFRMLALKVSAQNDMEKLKKEIAETQQLVKESIKAIQRLAHEFGA